MPAYFDQGFFVREPAWHELGIVLEEYPGREEAMRLAGHDFVVVEQPLYVPVPGDGESFRSVDGWKALMRHREGEQDHLMEVVPQSYGVVQNDIGWDLVDAIVGEGAKYETGITLQNGAVCAVLAWLDEPVTIPGDNSPIFPWLNVSWSHDRSGPLSCRPTSIRTVCWNTQTAAEAQGQRFDTEFTFKHTKNVMARVEDAKMAMRGLRAAHEEYLELARELAEIPITEKQRELFVCEFIPMPPEALISDRVERNVETARAAVRALFDGETVPEDHRFTAYGLHLAGGEYLDHLRGYRSTDTYFGRSMLKREPAKAKLTTLIRECAAA